MSIVVKLKREADEKRGFNEFIIRPSLASDLNWTEAGYNFPYGWIRSHWKKDGGNIFLELEIPANSHAEVRLPATMVSKLRLNGRLTSMTKHSDKAGPYISLKLNSGKHTLEF